MKREQDSVIRDQIVTATKGAFLSRGYAAVGMRDVSELSGIGLSQLYAYFDSKESILRAVLSPLDRSISKLFEKEETQLQSPDLLFSSEAYQEMWVREMVTFSINHRQELAFVQRYLGEPEVRKYWTEQLEKAVDRSMHFMSRLSLLLSEKIEPVSPLFIRHQTTNWMNVMLLVASTDDLSETGLEDFIKDYVYFGTGGWQWLLLPECRVALPRDNDRVPKA